MSRTHVLAATMAGLLLQSAAALDFDPLFFVTETRGDCFATLPDARRAIEVVPQKAYPFGTKITTGPDSEVWLQFSEGNFCVVHAATEAVITQGAGGASRMTRVVKLERGEASLRLVNDFNQEDNAGQRVTVQTAAAIGEPSMGGTYIVRVQPGKDATVCDFETDTGEMRVYDNHLFELVALKHDNKVRLVISDDKAYIQLRNVKGRLLVDLKNVTDDQGGPKLVEMQQDYMIKMWRRLTTTGNRWVVSILAVSSTGGLLDTVNYNVEAL